MNLKILEIFFMRANINLLKGSTLYIKNFKGIKVLQNIKLIAKVTQIKKICKLVEWLFISLAKSSILIIISAYLQFQQYRVDALCFYPIHNFDFSLNKLKCCIIYSRLYLIILFIPFIIQILQLTKRQIMSEPPNDDNFEYLAADDNLYADMQALWNKQLLQKEESIELELQEAKIKKKNIEKQKEEIGVRLYTAQQQLASNQMDYEKAHDNYNIAQRLRIQSQQKLAQVNQIYNGKKEQANILKNKVTKAQKQLQNLMRHYHEIQTYNLQLKSDIAVTKIETFTAEDNVSNLQKFKKKQDLLIDSMNEESKRLEQQKNILAAQIISQKEQTQEAKKILREAQAQMQKVMASKKNLMERWQKSIMLMQKKDSTVQTLRERLHDQNQKNVLLLSEISGIRIQIRKQQEGTQKLGAQSNYISKMKNNLQLVKNQLRQQEEKISAQLMMLKQSLGRTEEDIKITQNQQKTVQNSMSMIETNIMKLHQQTKKIYEQLVDQKSQHTTIQKTASNLLKQANKISIDIQQKQMDLQNLMNQIARVKIDQLNTKSQIDLLEQKKNEALAEQNQKKYLVITYEVQIRQGHDINQKKQHQVGRLNKLHDQLMSKANDEGKNPLQNKLINLIRQTQQLQKNCNQLYRQWIKKQTVLVHENNKLEELKEAVTQLYNKKTIMEQKKSRLNGNYEAFQKQISQIKINLKGLQQEMNKLNDTIAVNSDKKQKLQNQNVNLQSQFIQKLKEMEREAIKLQINIDKIRQEKAELMNQIVQCERQILLWERKYQLEKEMQEALDPNYGQSQIEDLKKELHRMQLKYSSLLKEQEKIGTEMLRAVHKKADIQLKHTATVKKEVVKKKQPETSNQLKSSIKKSRETQAKIMRSLQQTEKTLAKKQGQLQQISQALEQHNDELRNLESQSHHLQTQKVLAKIRKNTDVLKIAALQKKYKKLQQISNKTAKLMYQQPILREKLIQTKRKNQQLYGAIQQISQKYGQYSQLLAPLLQVSAISHQI